MSAIRMTQWCRHLPEHGWQPHVLCRYYGFSATPEQLAENVHAETKVEYLDRSSVGIQSVSLLQCLIRRIVNSRLLGGVFVPDVSIRFWRKHRQQILERVQAIQPEVIITTSPPHSNHDIGLWLARETGIPWVADFRDPYLIDNRFRPTGLGRLRWLAHERFRESIYRRAWLVTHAIPIQARWARRRLPFARNRIRILTNAFPMELLNELAKARHVSKHRKAVLVTGTIPEPEQLKLARAVSELARAGEDVELRLVGKISEQKEKIEQVLNHRFVATGYISHVESIREVARSSVLVNYLDRFRSNSRLLSTKLFEYLASGKPVVAINPSRSERLLLRRAKGVKCLYEPTVPLIAAALVEALHNPGRDSWEVEEFRRAYNWMAQSRNIASWLDRLVEFPPCIADEKCALSPVATIVIATRNRQELLHRPILSALNQSIPVEVIVVDDGSTDQTANMVRTKFPRVQLVRHEDSHGYIVRRNEAAKLASTPVIFSIDDDAEFSSPRVVEQTLAEFEHPRIGAVAIPCTDVRKDLMFRQGVANEPGLFVIDSFVGTAHAVLRDVFIHIGGYRDNLVHQGEERDFCLRMLNRGWVVRLGNADPIRHYESPNRDVRRMDHYGRRNDVLFAWQNVPASRLPVHLAGTTLKGLISGVQSGHWIRMMQGAARAYVEIFQRAYVRQPVPLSIYRLHRRLKKGGPLRLQDIDQDLPPLLNIEMSKADAARVLT